MVDYKSSTRYPMPFNRKRYMIIFIVLRRRSCLSVCPSACLSVCAVYSKTAFQSYGDNRTLIGSRVLELELAGHRGHGVAIRSGQNVTQAEKRSSSYLRLSSWLSLSPNHRRGPIWPSAGPQMKL